MRQDPDSHSQKKAARPDKGAAPAAAPQVFFNEDPAASLLREYPFLEAPAQPGEPCRLAGYEVLRVLGAGGMGVVFLGRDPRLEREVALKVIKVRAGSASEGEVQRKRLIREARAAAKIQSDHVVRIHEVGEANGAPFIAMELLAGADLETMEARWRQTGGGLPLRETLRIGKEIARGLAAAHHLGIVHRDITPRNLWVDSGNDNRIKILDFGLCKSLLADDETLTQQGITQGTPGFMPPEQVRGEDIDSRADLFNLGVILYWLCTGKRPFHRGKAILDTLNATVKVTPSAPAELAPDIPARLSALILKLLQKDRDNRPQTAQSVGDELDAVARDHATAPTAALPPHISTLLDDTAQQSTLALSVPPIGTQGVTPPRTSEPRHRQNPEQRRKTKGFTPGPKSTSAVSNEDHSKLRAIAVATTLLAISAIGIFLVMAAWREPATSPQRIPEVQVDAGVAPAPPADEFVSRGTGMIFRLIPAGEFMMGSPDGEADRSPAEGPQHRVRISKPFYMGVYEVTQGEFETVMGRNSASFSSSGGRKERVTGKDTSRFPVENVTWFDAVEMCNRLSTSDGLTEYYGLTGIERNTDQSIKAARVTVSGGAGYRLPTEAEWEYSCRAGTTSPFHFGGVNDGSRANVDGNNPYGTSTKGTYLKRTTGVGSYAPNAFGLYDMHGNVYEWCFDAYDENAYKNRTGTAADPIVSVQTNDQHVLRGGSWYYYSRYSRSANRGRSTPDRRYYIYGFRFSRTP